MSTTMRKAMGQAMTQAMSRVIGRVMPKAILLCLPVVLTSLALAQSPVNPRLLAARWPAQWIAAPATPPFEYGVYHFRKSFELPEVPGQRRRADSWFTSPPTTATGFSSTAAPLPRGRRRAIYGTGGSIRSISAHI